MEPNIKAEMGFVDNEELWNEDGEKNNSRGYIQLLYFQMGNNLKHNECFIKHWHQFLPNMNKNNPQILSKAPLLVKYYLRFNWFQIILLDCIRGMLVGNLHLYHV